MREIKFRGLEIIRGVTSPTWVYGDYISNPGWEEIVHYDRSKPIISGIRCKVDPKTVGQFTGLLDRNGKEIYEGDLYITGSMKAVRQIFYHNGAFCGGMFLEESTPLCWDSDGEDLIVDDFISCIEVIGNIYENLCSS